MSLAILLAAAIVGPQPACKAEDWQSRYQQTMAQTADRFCMPAAEAVPKLVDLYVAVSNTDDLPRVERSRMKRSLERRLVKYLEKLVRAERQRIDTHQRNAGHSLPGGGASEAQQLIELIVNTISPDSWRQNGGQGSISFYPHNPALVIRQTAETHEQVAELLQALRR